MDYFTGCSELSTTNPRCDPTMALFWLAPWLSYANFLLAAKNRTVLIDVGVAMDPANATTGHPNYPNNHWISSELDLESFFHRSYGSIKSLQGEGPTSGDPGMLPPFMKSWCTVSARLFATLANDIPRWVCVFTPVLCSRATRPTARAATTTADPSTTLRSSRTAPTARWRKRSPALLATPSAARPRRAQAARSGGMAYLAGRHPRCSMRAALQISSASAQPDTCVLSPILLRHSSSYPPC